MTHSLFERRASVIATAMTLGPKATSRYFSSRQAQPLFFQLPQYTIAGALGAPGACQSGGPPNRKRKGSTFILSTCSPYLGRAADQPTNPLPHCLIPRTPPLVASPVSNEVRGRISNPNSIAATLFCRVIHPLTFLKPCSTLFPCIYLLHFPPAEFHFLALVI